MSSTRKRPPMQPIAIIDGVARFQANTVVRYLSDAAGQRGLDLNHLALVATHARWPDSDRAQFAQLIGYPVSGYGDLSYAQRVGHADEKVHKILAGSTRSSQAVTVTLSGGQAFERNAIAGEITAVLESLGIGAIVEGTSLVINDADEQRDILHTIATSGHTVIIKRAP